MNIRSCAKCVPPERHIGCHSNCPKYLAEKAAVEAEKNIIEERRRADNIYTSYHHATVLASTRRSGRI